MKKIAIMLIVLLTVSSSVFSTTDYTFKDQNGAVEFKAKGWPNLLKINGKGAGFTGEVHVADNKASGVLKMNLDTLKTGISLRDDHMKNKYLNVKEFPTAELEIINVIVPEKLKGTKPFNGKLTLHGVTKNVEGVVKFNGLKKDKAKIDAEFDIKISDFNIELPSFKGITVAEDVKVKVSSKAEVKINNNKRKEAEISSI